MGAASKIRTTVALLIAIAGVAVICFVPYTRMTYSRDRVDLERARAPLVRVPLKDLGPDQDRVLTVVPPTDQQWQRLSNRLGKPAYVLTVGTDRAAIHPKAYSATDAQLQAHGMQAGRPVGITLTKELPFDYSSSASQTAYKFSLTSNDVVELTVRMAPA